MLQPVPEGARVALELVALRQQIDRLELAFSQLATAFDKTEYWDEEGSNSAIDWIRFNCRMTSTAAADRVAVGERLTQMPHSAQAMAEGTIGFAHMTVMARTARDVGSKDQGAERSSLATNTASGQIARCRRHGATGTGQAANVCRRDPTPSVDS